MKVTNDTNSRKVEPRLAIYLGRSNGDESPSLDSPVIAAGPTSLCYLGTGQCCWLWLALSSGTMARFNQSSGVEKTGGCLVPLWMAMPS